MWCPFLQSDGAALFADRIALLGGLVDAGVLVLCAKNEAGCDGE